LQLAERGDGLFVEEARSQSAQPLAALGVERGRPRQGCAGGLPGFVGNRGNARPQPARKPLDQRNMPGRKLCQRGLRVRCMTGSPSLPPPPLVVVRGTLRATGGTGVRACAESASAALAGAEARVYTQAPFFGAISSSEAAAQHSAG